MGPARFHCATLLSSTLECQQIVISTGQMIYDEKTKNFLSEVGFEPTPTEVDCDLNAAP